MQRVALVGMIEDMAETRGQRLRQRRKAAGIKQEDLADRARVAVRTLQNLEAGMDAERNMRKTADTVEEALTAMLAELPPPEPAGPQRRLRSVEAIIRDEEDVISASVEEVLPGVRRASIILLDSDVPMTDEIRAALLRMRDEAQRDSPER